MKFMVFIFHCDKLILFDYKKKLHVHFLISFLILASFRLKKKDII